VVLSDRYLLSTLAYSSLENDEELFEDISKHFLQPDMTVFLDVPPKTAIKRISHRGEETELFEKEEFLEKISASYKRHLQSVPEEKKMILDGRRPIGELSKIIEEYLIRNLG